MKKPTLVRGFLIGSDSSESECLVLVGFILSLLLPLEHRYPYFTYERSSQIVGSRLATGGLFDPFLYFDMAQLFN